METTCRTSGRSGTEVCGLGLGCWVIGGEWSGPGGEPYGWGAVDDEEAARAIRRAVDLGVNFFATADNYGTGHSERCPGARGRGAAGRRRHRHEVGNLFDEETRTAVGGADDSAAYARRALIASLKRLGTNHVDLYPLHIGARGATPERGPRNSLTTARSSCGTA